MERETEEYHKADPDPFDDRHPGIGLLLLIFSSPSWSFFTIHQIVLNVAFWALWEVSHDCFLFVSTVRTGKPRVHARTPVEDPI